MFPRLFFSKKAIIFRYGKQKTFIVMGILFIILVISTTIIIFLTPVKKIQKTDLEK